MEAGFGEGGVEIGEIEQGDFAGAHTVWSDVKLFIPYSQLDLEQYSLGQGQHDFYVLIQAQDLDGNVVGAARNLPFHYTK